jgi:hypothetical protein
MPKFLLAMLMVVAEAIPSRAGDPAAQATADEPGTVAIAVEQVGEIATKLKGRVLGSRIRKGMTLEEVEEILGHWNGLELAGPGLWVSYSHLRMSVVISFETNAANDSATVVTDISFMSILPERRPAIVLPPPAPPQPPPVVPAGSRLYRIRPRHSAEQ